jgi:site-specific recombinase XerD
LAFVGSAKGDLSAITHKDVLACIEHEQDRGMGAQTVNVRVRLLRTFLRYLLERDAINAEAVAKRIVIKEPDALPRAMDPEDVKSLLDVLDSVRDRAMILVLLRTGMRIGELLNTLVPEVYLKERKIEIYEAEKTRVGRVVYLSDDACLALASWFEIRNTQKNYVFYTHRDRMSYAAARSMFVGYLQKAGIGHKGYSLHCLRHTFASELLNAGMRIECLQPLLGHSCIEMTRRYARLTDKTREEEYFKAMAVIEKGEVNGHYRMDRQLQEIFKAEELFTAHHQKLHEHPQTVYPVVEGSGGGSDSQNN